MNTLSKFSALAAAAALAALPLAPASAQAVSPSVNASVRVDAAAGIRPSVGASSTLQVHPEKRIASSTQVRAVRVDARAAQELDQRIASLQQVSAHFADMKLLPASDLAALQASISSEIGALNALKAKIAADDSTTTLKADAQSITKSYRVYALVIPQDRIASAADRVLAVAAQMQALSAKFAARISAAGAVGASVTSAKADFDAKVADAQVQANAAIASIAKLSPDNGDASTKASNTAALKAALADIKAAQQDLRAARQDAAAIVKGVAGKPGASGSASSTASARL